MKRANKVTSISIVIIIGVIIAVTQAAFRNSATQNVSSTADTLKISSRNDVDKSISLTPNGETKKFKVEAKNESQDELEIETTLTFSGNINENVVIKVDGIKRDGVDVELKKLVKPGDTSSHEIELEYKNPGLGEYIESDEFNINVMQVGKIKDTKWESNLIVDSYKIEYSDKGVDNRIDVPIVVKPLNGANLNVTGDSAIKNTQTSVSSNVEINDGAPLKSNSHNRGLYYTGTIKAYNEDELTKVRFKQIPGYSMVMIAADKKGAIAKEYKLAELNGYYEANINSVIKDTLDINEGALHFILVPQVTAVVKNNNNISNVLVVKDSKGVEIGRIPLHNNEDTSIVIPEYKFAINGNMESVNAFDYSYEKVGSESASLLNSNPEYDYEIIGDRYSGYEVKIYPKLFKFSYNKNETEATVNGFVANVDEIIEKYNLDSNVKYDVVIPNKIEGKPVTEIGYAAFRNNELTSVVIPNSVTEIGGSAFWGNQLTSVVIPDSVTEIGGLVFYSNELTSVVIPNSVTEIGRQAFNRNQLTSVVIPDSVTSIGEGAFRYNKLTSIDIPDSVTSIGAQAFQHNELTSVDIPDSVTMIEEEAFQDNNLTSVEIPDSVTDIGANAFHQNELTSVDIPNSVTSIGDSAFYQNQLTSVVIPNSVTTIGANAFRENKLTSVVIPNSVTTIGARAFHQNVGGIVEADLLEGDITGVGPTLRGYKFETKWTHKLPYDPLFTYKDDGASVTVTGFNLTYIENELSGVQPTEIKIPDTYKGKPVKAIGNSAFRDNQLTSVDIPNSVTWIGRYAFAYNELTSVIIPDSVTEIGRYAFAYNELTSVIIPNSVTSIRSGAFESNQLTSVIIPDSVTSIGDYAFHSNKLTSVVIPNSVTEIGSNAFAYNQLTSVTIPNSVKVIGRHAFYQNELTSVDIPDSVTEIGRYAFAYNELTSVIIPNSVTWIDAYAFYHNKLTSVIIPDSVTAIGEWAFYENQLTSIVIPDSVTTIGDQAFHVNTGGIVHANLLEGDITGVGPTLRGYKFEDKWTHRLYDLFTYSDDGATATVTGFNSTYIENELSGVQPTDIKIPDTYNGKPVTTIDRSAFRLNKLTSVVIPDSVTSIGALAFEHNQLTSVIIPNSVTRIEERAFQYNQLTSVVIPDSVTTIDYAAFRDNKLTSVEIPDSVTEIGSAAFRENKLTSVVIPDSVTTIDGYAFAYNQLTSVVIPDSVTEIRWGAFQKNNLTSLKLGNSVTKIGGHAFRDNELTSVVIPDSVTSIGDEAFHENVGGIVKGDLLEGDITGVGPTLRGYKFETKWTHKLPYDPLFTYKDDGASVTVTGFNSTYIENELSGIQPTDIKIPDTYKGKPVTAIGGYAFIWNQLTSVVIPNSVTEIGEGAFFGNKLTSVDISDSVTTIGTAAFRDNKLTSVVIPNSVTEIGSGAFYQNQLTSVVIPDSVTSIGESVFEENKLTSVVIPDSVTEIGMYAFQYNELTSIVIPDSVTEIGARAFSGNQLTSVVIPDSVTEIGNHAFNGNKLTSIVIPDSVTSIGDEAFHYNVGGTVYANELGKDSWSTLREYTFEPIWNRRPLSEYKK